MTAVRPATSADVAGIAAVHVRAWQVAYANVFPAPLLDALSPERRAAQWSRTLEDPAFDLLVAAGDEVRGFVSLGPSERVTDAGEVWAIYVDPSSWRHGLGTLLLDGAVERLTERGYSEAILWTLARTAQSRAFYEANGWIAGETRVETFFGEVEEELVLYRRALS